MVELQLVMYIKQIVMFKLVGVLDKRLDVMYNLWAPMRKKSLQAYFMPFFIDCKLLYQYLNSFLKVYFIHNDF